MEPPPGNFSDGLQPQDLSTAWNLSTGFDLARNGEECLLKASSIEALHVVQQPSWFISYGTGNRMVLSEDDCTLPSQPSDQIQPENAFSNTTVTLSYVSRSHVFNTQNLHSQIYGVPISKTFSLHPTVYDAAQLVTDTGGAPLCVEMDQHCLQQVSVPVGLAACANSFELVSPAEVVENVTRLCYLQAPHDIGGITDVESFAFETFKSLQENISTDCGVPLNLNEMENSGVNGLWNSSAFDGSVPGSHITTAEDQFRNGKPELFFLISRSDKPVFLQNSEGPAGLAVSLNQNFVSAPEDRHLSPVASIDEVKNVFFMPQTVCSPSEENSYVEETCNTEDDKLSMVESDPTSSVEETESSSVPDIALRFNTSISSKGRNVDICKAEQSERGCGLSEVKKDHKRQIKKGSKHMSVDILPKKKTFVRKELPPRTRKGMRLEAIVHNFYPTRNKSNHVSSTKQLWCANAHVSFVKSIQNVMDEVFTKTNEITAQLQEEEEEGVNSLSRSKCKMPTSCSKRVLKHSLDHTFTETKHKSMKYKKKSKKQQKKTQSSVKTEERIAMPTAEFCTKSPSKQQISNNQIRGSLKTKKIHTPKRKRKKHKDGQASFFSSQEPEIKLKYVNYKKKKQEKKETFLPFVHVELNVYPTCTVINYPEESVRLNRGKQQMPKVVTTGAVPEMPCLQYGRVYVEASEQVGPLVCCLCGGSANAMDLGDLYGPYYPEDFNPVSQMLANAEELREGDSSDSDCFCNAESTKHAALTNSGWTQKACHKLHKATSLEVYPRWTSESGLSHSFIANRSRLDTITDWYTPPVVPLETNEYWFHEDCGIWSAGVLLVRGKLYGLDRTVKMAKGTICSSCHKTGATLGCLFKACPNKYHYICAIRSGCVLNEENFSMKCRKHMNKSIKSATNKGQNSR